MPKIIFDASTEIEELDEAIYHLRNTAKNSHDLAMIRWCALEIDRFLDAKLASVK